MTQQISPARQRFLALLRRDILELDAAELDFGIYRVLNHRRATVERFLGEELPAQIDSALAALPGTAGEDEQARIYNALYTFFARYYDSGDFLPRPRRGRTGRYMVPYDGSDTHFHWATKGSHYVKSGERFAGYAYQQPGGVRVRLAVQSASVERDNAKGAQRHYVPVALQPPGAAHPGEWRLTFEHRVLTDAELLAAGGGKKRRGAAAAVPEADPAADSTDPAQAADAAEGASVQERVLNAWLAAHAAPAGIDAALLARHALRYVKGQTTDFFVHPQLGRFLRDELDTYLQTEFVNLWDVPDAALARERGKLAICRRIGRAIIDVLAALEDLQAALFEKRKFVLGASYLVMCSWLGAQGAVGAALVAQAAAHGPQVARWRQWLGEPDGSTQDGPALLARCPHLPLDTALFDEAFQWAVLAAVPDMQAALGGILVHGDNYAALRTLEAQWRAAVKCIYIDPPYNTGNDGFIYRDDCQHSSWASLIVGRTTVAVPLLGDDGAFFMSIDDSEGDTAAKICDEIFGAPNFIARVIWEGANKNTARQIGVSHEYVLAYAKDRNVLPHEWSVRKEGVDQVLAEVRRLSQLHGDDHAMASRELAGWFLAMKAKPAFGLRRFRQIDSRGAYKEDDPTAPGGRQFRLLDPRTGTEIPLRVARGWAFDQETFNQLLAEDRIRFVSPRTIMVKRYLHETDHVTPSSVIYQPARSASERLAGVLGAPVFDYPKDELVLQKFVEMAAAELKSCVLDYFAGSGTTAHAVINLNRDDGGERKFILVEQGEYFDTVTLPRVAKVMACPEWKDGRPKDGVQHDADAAEDADVHWSRRTLPIVQVLRIERYEDSLDALALPGAAAATGQAELAGFDALLRYVADAQDSANPVRLSTAALARPLDYRLPTVWEGRAVERPVDLLHTALLLLGLHPVRLRRLARPPAAGGGFALLAEVRPHRPGQPASAVPLELLLLREHDTDTPTPDQLAKRMQTERDWLVATVQTEFGRALASYACTHHNRDLLLSGEGERGHSVDAALAQAMWARDPAFSAQPSSQSSGGA